MKKRLFAILLAGCLAASMTACGGNAGGAQSGNAGSAATQQSKTSGAGDTTLRLAWLGSGQDKESLDKCLQKYTDDTKVGVETVYIPGTWAEYFTKMQTMIAGGDYIDNAYVAIEGYSMFINMGMAAPLTQWTKDHADEYKALQDDIEPNIWNAVTFDGELYGMPEEWNNVVTHFNTKLLKEAGLKLPPANWTKDDFLSYCEKLTKDVDGVKQYAVAVPGYYFGFEGWLYNAGGSYMNEDFTKSNLASPECIEMFQFCQDLIYKYGYAPIPEKNVDDIQQLVDGRVAMGFWGRWPTNNYKTNGFSDVAVQYVPNFKESVANTPIYGGGAIFTMKTSKHYDEATSLGAYIASPPFIEQFMAAGAIPVLTSVAQKLVPALGYPENNQIFYESAKIAKPVQAPAQYPECEALFSRVCSDILVNQADVETTLKSAQDEMDGYLSANIK